MSEISWSGGRSSARSMAGERTSANLADLLERILDKGIVIVGDIRINLLDIELLTIKLRLLVASVDRAREMGIDWWEHDPSLSSKARQAEAGGGEDDRALREENRRLRERLAALEAATADNGTVQNGTAHNGTAQVGAGRNGRAGENGAAASGAAGEPDAARKESGS